MMAFGQETGPVVRPPVRVAHSVCQLMFDKFGALSQHFVQYGPRRRPEAVGCLLPLKSQFMQGNSNCGLAHRLVALPVGWEGIPPAPRQFVKVAQYGDGLYRQRDDMRLPHLHFLCGDAPRSRVKVNLGQLRLA